MSSKQTFTAIFSLLFSLLFHIANAQDGNCGIVFKIDEAAKLPKVTYPFIGSPAWAAGVKSSDYILSVNDSSTYGLSSGAFSDLADKKAGETISLTLRRGEKVLKISFLSVSFKQLTELKYAYILNTTLQAHNVPKNTPVMTNYGMLFNRNDKINYAEDGIYLGYGVFGRTLYKALDWGATSETQVRCDALGNNNTSINLGKNLNRIIFIDSPTIGTNNIYFLVKETDISNRVEKPAVVTIDGDVICSASYTDRNVYNKKHVSNIRFVSNNILALQAHEADDKNKSWCIWNLITNSFSDYNFKIISSYTNGHAIARTNSNQIVLLDENGKVIKKMAQAESKDYYSEHDFYGNFFTFRKSGATQFMDINGDELFKVDQYIFSSHNIGYNLVCLNLGNYDYPVWKYYYTSGKEFNYPDMEKLEPFQYGRARIKTKNGFGFINESGLLAIPDTFLNATNFNSQYNYAAVQKKATQQWLIIDSAGTPLGDLGYMAAKVEMEKDGLFKITRNTRDKMSIGDGPYVTYYADVYGHHYYDYDKTKPLQKNPDYAKYQNEMNAISTRIKTERKNSEAEYARQTKAQKSTLQDDNDEDVLQNQKSLRKKSSSSVKGTVTCGACHGTGQIHETIYGGAKGANGQTVFGSYSQCTACGGKGSN